MQKPNQTILIYYCFYVCLFFHHCSTKKENKKSEDIHQKGMETQVIPSPAKNNSGEPNLFVDHLGNTYLTWIEAYREGHQLKLSTYKNNKWSTPRLITEGNNWFVNWADFPSLTVNKDGRMLAHYLKKSGEDSYAYDIEFMYSDDEGKSWSPSTKLNTDGTLTEHGFVSVVPYSNNQFFISWLDGRNTIMAGSHEASEHGGQGAMTLRAGFINDAGQIFNESQIDQRVCDCCQTDAVMTDEGPIVVYRDRSEKEIRDISIVKFVNDKWTQPISVYDDGWQIAGCPVNGPAIDAKQKNIVIAWFTGAKNEPKVNVVFSSDNGNTFGKPIQIDNENPVGRVDVVMLEDHTAMVSWIEMQEDEAKLLIAHVLENGTISNTYDISTVSPSRSSGVPRMVRVADNTLMITWTEGETESSIRTVKVNL